MPEKQRDTNLDVLRASAIIMVIVYHIAQRWLPANNAITTLLLYGQYGVDLFFVLSGWLIGGLLWKELKRAGRVDVPRFIGRRLLRTIPTYYVALGAYSAGVVITKDLPLEAGYLLFTQNYHAKITYFLISWSLCVEEHFYLVLPLIILPIVQRWRCVILYSPVLALLPSIVRALQWKYAQGAPFGFYYTASHLRYEGLLLGVWAAYIHANSPASWLRLKYLSSKLLPITIPIAILCECFAPQWHYTFFYLAISTAFLSVLILLAGAPAPAWLRGKAVFWIAITSYSVYLTHAIALDISSRLSARLNMNASTTVVFSLLLIAAIGFLFYHTIERNCLILRDHLVPAKARSRRAILGTSG